MNSIVKTLRRHTDILPTFMALGILMAGLPCSVLAGSQSLFNPNDYPDSGPLILDEGELEFDTRNLTMSGAASADGMFVENESKNVILALFNFSEINLGSNVVITVHGECGLVLASKKDITFGSRLDLSGAHGDIWGVGGPGAEGGVPNFVTPTNSAFDSAPPPLNAGDGGQTYYRFGVGSGGGGGDYYAAGGAGYGGAGGCGARSTRVTGIAGRAYGDNRLTDLYGGSGGGGAKNSPGGGGGGAVEMIAAGALRMSGVIDVSGGTGKGVSSSYAAGGGSGGGVILAAPTLDVSGLIDASGGDGGSSHYDRGAGGGGGGRVAWRYNTLIRGDLRNINIKGGLADPLDPNEPCEGRDGLDGTFESNAGAFPFVAGARGLAIRIR